MIVHLPGNKPKDDIGVTEFVEDRVKVMSYIIKTYLLFDAVYYLCHVVPRFLTPGPQSKGPKLRTKRVKDRHTGTRSTEWKDTELKEVTF